LKAKALEFNFKTETTYIDRVGRNNWNILKIKITLWYWS